MTRTLLVAVSLWSSSLAFAGSPKERLAVTPGGSGTLGTAGPGTGSLGTGETAKLKRARGTPPDLAPAPTDGPKEQPAAPRPRGK